MERRARPWLDAQPLAGGFGKGVAKPCVSALQRPCPAQRNSKGRIGMGGHVDAHVSLHRCTSLHAMRAMRAMRAMQAGWGGCNPCNDAIPLDKAEPSLWRAGWAHAEEWTCHAPARRAAYFGRSWELRCKAVCVAGCNAI